MEDSVWENEKKSSERLRRRLLTLINEFYAAVLGRNAEGSEKKLSKLFNHLMVLI
jgi:hypothetical protein